MAFIRYSSAARLDLWNLVLKIQVYALWKTIISVNNYFIAEKNYEFLSAKFGFFSRQMVLGTNKLILQLP